MTSGIIINALTFTHPSQKNPTINKLTLSICSDGFSALLGVSASGKTTLLEIIAGVYRPDTPDARLDGGITVDGHPPGEKRAPGALAMMFQNSVLLDHLTVLDNTLLPITLTASRTEAKEYKTRAEYLLEALHVNEHASKKPLELSGGTKKRVDLARVLLCNPRILLLDEPFSGIDVFTKASIYRLLYIERNKPGLITIFATHDLTDAALLASNVYFLGSRNGTSICKTITNTPTINKKDNLEECVSLATAIEPKLANLLHMVSY